MEQTGEKGIVNGRDEKPSFDSLKTQYDKLSEDWRQFNNILWGIPSVAVSIMAGIIVVAYQPQLEGWPRFITLSIGSLFLFALTLEVSKKRLHMNIVEVKLKNLQESALKISEQYELSWFDAYRKYWKNGKHIEPYKGLFENEGHLFHFIMNRELHAPKFLLSTIFSAAIGVGILAVLHLTKIIVLYYHYNISFVLP